ncbi:MAG: hypothetical protein ABIP94_02830, partial [Planctomycetota bacterium]
MPDAAARAQVQAQLLDVLATLLVERSSVAASERLSTAAADPARSPALRFELYEQAMRCACAADDVAAGLRTADAAANTFVVDGARAACLERFEAAARVPAQTLIAAHLGTAERAIEFDAPACAAALQHARRLAVVDRPRGLRGYVEAVTCELEQARTAYERLGAEPLDAAQIARYRAFYFGDWQGVLSTGPTGDDRVARILAAKIAAHAESGDVVAIARSGEQWLSQALIEADSLAQRHLRRRAMQLLLPMSLYRAPETDPPSKPVVEAVEVQRVQRLLDRTSELAVEPVVGSLCFRDAGDLERWHIDGGA